MTRVVTACSDIFDQDVEDLPPQDAGTGATPAAAAKKVERASAKAAAAPAAAAGPHITDARRVKDVRVFGTAKNNYAVTLDGDPVEYTTKDAKLAAELEKFKGTDHLVVLVFEDNEWNGKTYHNIQRLSVDPPARSSDAAPLTADDIPF